MRGWQSRVPQEIKQLYIVPKVFHQNDPILYVFCESEKSVWGIDQWRGGERNGRAEIAMERGQHSIFLEPSSIVPKLLIMYPHSI
jgi:hypothetical protein